MKNHKKNQNIKSTAKNHGFHHSQKNDRHSSSQNFSDNSLLVFGKHPTFTILEKRRRKVFEIFVTRNTEQELQEFLKKHSITHPSSLIKIVDNNQIDSLVGRDQAHQGFAMRVAKLPIKNQNDLLEELYAFEEGAKLPTLVMLDQISDPHNVGAIIRSAISFGAKKIIFCEHNAPKENATIIKASSGTIESADLFVVTNFSNLIEKLKKIDYWCIGLDGNSQHKITEIRDYKNVALIIGSEGNGIRDLVKKNCDILAKIEIDKEVESLNASVAASIALYELSQRKNV